MMRERETREDLMRGKRSVRKNIQMNSGVLVGHRGARGGGGWLAGEVGLGAGGDGGEEGAGEEEGEADEGVEPKELVDGFNVNNGYQHHHSQSSPISTAI